MQILSGFKLTFRDGWRQRDCGHDFAEGVYRMYHHKMD